MRSAVPAPVKAAPPPFRFLFHTTAGWNKKGGPTIFMVKAASVLLIALG